MSKNTDASTSGFTALSFVWRLLAALLLVLLTFNPTGYSAYHWTIDAVRESGFGPLNLLAIAVLLAGWAVFGMATWRALDTLGVVLSGLVLGAIVWLLVDLGVISTESTTAITWIALVCIAVILAIGVSWSHISRRLTGQLNVEHVDD
ncbi:MAG TPA: DUF6524 family protein [Woeseiaceae bacterium]|nr:DUF6524 family protein [Woeseiaceae bacterium]